MNNLFRNIRENKNLDLLEMSDSEEEFENIDPNKFVDLEKTLYMNCRFIKKFRKWIPLAIADKGHGFFLNKFQEQKECVFKVKASIEEDVYTIFSRNGEYGNLLIQNYKTSVMMNNLFRNIRENKNLDLLAMSDSEEEFENIDPNKFVDLEKTLYMNCRFIKKFRKWIPLAIADKGHGFFLNKFQEQKECVFKVKASIEEDVYTIFSRNGEYGNLLIQNYKTSVMMNNLFRNIRENKNLDLLEMSDSEEEFENIDPNKFVDLEKTLYMNCRFIKKFRKWIPLAIADKGHGFFLNKFQEQKECVFKVKASIEEDVYTIFSRNGEYGNLLIQNYKTSVMMNNLFRNIRENKNLDLLEESDNEEEFNDIRENKYVDLEKHITMECKYNEKFEKWIPNNIANNVKITDFYEINKILKKI
jgi:cytidylate kinase